VDLQVYSGEKRPLASEGISLLCLTYLDHRVWWSNRQTERDRVETGDLS